MNEEGVSSWGLSFTLNMRLALAVTNRESEQQ